MGSFWTNPIRLMAVYVALNLLILLAVGMLVTRARLATATEAGEGGDPQMIRALSAHRSNVEFVPATLLTMVLACVLGGSLWIVHAIGAPLTIGRILHGVGVSRNAGTSPLRFLGQALTWFALIAGIIALIWLDLIPVQHS